MEKQIVDTEKYYKDWLKFISSEYGDDVAEKVKYRIESLLKTEYKSIVTTLTNLRLLRLSKYTKESDVQSFMAKQLNASCDSYTDTIMVNYDDCPEDSALFILGFDIVIARWS